MNKYTIPVNSVEFKSMLTTSNSKEKEVNGGKIKYESLKK